jgi:hypothetical protein
MPETSRNARVRMPLDVSLRILRLLACASEQTTTKQKIKCAPWIYIIWSTVVYYCKFDALDENLIGVPLRQQRPLIFAQEIKQSKPDLAQFIYDMAAIPIMSAECECIFSSAKLLLSDQRARMKP